jgi:hypothetical protein
MPDSLRNVAREPAVVPARSRPVSGFFLGVWLHVMWGWCHVSTWAYAVYILTKKVAIGLLGVGILSRRQRPIPEWLALTALKVLWALVRRFGQLILWVWARAVNLLRRIWRVFEDLFTQFQRTQNQLKKRATWSCSSA